MIPVRVLITRYHGPTNTRGPRVSARVPSGRRVTLGWDYASSIEENHDRVATKLAAILGWDPPTMAGNLPGDESDRVYVVAPKVQQ